MIFGVDVKYVPKQKASAADRIFSVLRSTASLCDMSRVQCISVSVREVSVCVLSAHSE